MMGKMKWGDCVTGFTMDVFSDTLFGGNQAGVVLPDRVLSDGQMQQIAAELKHSETVFVTDLQKNEGRFRYFTPTEEVPVCGHGTIAACSALLQTGAIVPGMFQVHTGAGDIPVDVGEDLVWADLGTPVKREDVPETLWQRIYGAFGLSESDCPQNLKPEIWAAGLADILLPVRNHDILMRARQNEREVTEISAKLQVTGVHMFCLGEGSTTAYCSNFAPGCGIPEECATGTSNGSLTGYLHARSLIQEGRENLFIQGQHMERPSWIYTRLHKSAEGSLSVQIGGNAVMSMELNIRI